MVDEHDDGELQLTVLDVTISRRGGSGAKGKDLTEIPISAGCANV